MEISNDVLFMLAIVLLFFCLMKDRPCNVEGLDTAAVSTGAPASPTLESSQYMVKPEGIFRNETGPRKQWFINQEPVDFRKCQQKGGKCIECKSIATLADGCKYTKGQEYEFDLNSNKAKRKLYKYALADGDCEGAGCGIICDSQAPDGIKTPDVGFPAGQNGLFCKV